MTHTATRARTNRIAAVTALADMAFAKRRTRMSDFEARMRRQGAHMIAVPA